jgi:hypothetical protein
MAPVSNAAPETRPITVENIYAPLGFDSNDTAEIIVKGYMPNSCYHLGDIHATIDEDRGTIDLTASGTVTRDVTCLQIIMPYTQTVKLGNLRAGTYTLSVVNQPEQEFGQLIIDPAAEESPGEPRGDSFYVPADRVDLQRGDDGREYLTLSGTYPYMFIGCMLLDTVQTTFDGQNVLVIEPFGLFTDGRSCEPQADDKHYSTTVALDQNLPSGILLLHVKVSYGEAINRFVEIE